MVALLQAQHMIAVIWLVFRDEWLVQVQLTVSGAACCWGWVTPARRDLQLEVLQQQLESCC